MCVYALLNILKYSITYAYINISINIVFSLLNIEKLNNIIFHFLIESFLSEENIIVSILFHEEFFK